MPAVTYVADQLFDGDQIRPGIPVTVENGHVTAVGARAAGEVRLHGLLAPGFIDLQVNGGGGKLFNAEPTLACIKTIGAAHARFGTTGWLPTVVTDSIETMERAADAVALAREIGALGVLGIHFEGPHLAAAKKGIHAQAHLRPLGPAEFALMTRTDLGARVVTLAPETVPPADIERLVAANVRVCLGHSNADFETVQHALTAGATGFTHLFNAMSPLCAREPGMVGAALLDELTWCGIVADGAHVHDATLQIAVKVKPRGKVFLVTDAMPPVGSDEREFEFFGGKVRCDGDRLLSQDGVLAGSMLDMSSAVRNTVQRLEVPLPEALRMASLYPSSFLGMNRDRGRIAAGMRADLVLLDDDQGVTACWIGGEMVHGASEPVPDPPRRRTRSR